MTTPIEEVNFGIPPHIHAFSHYPLNVDDNNAENLSIVFLINGNLDPDFTFVEKPLKEAHQSGNYPDKRFLYWETFTLSINERRGISSLKTTLRL